MADESVFWAYTAEVERWMLGHAETRRTWPFWLMTEAEARRVAADCQRLGLFDRVVARRAELARSDRAGLLTGQRDGYAALSLLPA